MIQVENQFNSEGMLYERLIKKDGEFYSSLHLIYENNRLASKYHIKIISNDRQLTTHYWGFFYDENQNLISNYKTNFYDEKLNFKCVCTKNLYEYESQQLIKICEVEMGFGGVYKNKTWSTNLEYNNNKLVMLRKNVFEIDLFNQGSYNINFDVNKPFTEVPFEENEVIYLDNKVIGKSYFSLHEDLYNGQTSYNAFRYDKFGQFFWDYSWYQMLDSMDEYDNYIFDCDYQFINDKIGERLRKAKVSHNGTIIGIITNSYSKR